MTWTPPDQPHLKGYQPGGPGHGLPPFPSPVPSYAQPAGPAGPQPKPAGPAKRSWRIAHSAWVVTPMLPFGCLAATGFLYVGIRARRTSWAVAGVLYSVVTNICFFFGAEAAEGSAVQNICYAIMFLLWPISVAHALVINGSWLRWRAGHVPWYSQGQPVAWAGPAAPVTPPLPPQLQQVVPPAEQFYGTPGPAFGSAPGPVLGGPAADPTFGVSTAADPTSAPAASFAGSPPGSGRLDVNAASEQQLAAVPGLGPERAARIIAARLSRGGFHGLSEVAAVAGLAPHEFVAVRDRLSCEPPPPPDSGEPSPFGRIVDV